MARNRPLSKRVETKPPQRSRSIHLVVIGILLALTLTTYFNSLSTGLTYDNHYIIGQDLRLRANSGQNIGLIFSKDYWNGLGPTDLYRPLTTLSYWFNYSVLGSGLNLESYHVVNLAVHAVNVVLVYIRAFFILSELWSAAVVAGLWAVHPILTESITN